MLTVCCRKWYETYKAMSRPAGASFFVYKHAVFLLCFHSNIITKGHHNAGNKAIGFCHTVRWYDLHVTSDTNALADEVL